MRQKKVMEKKVAIEKGLRFRGITQGEGPYLFEFDTKEVYAESNQLYLNFYHPEAEEQRDSQGVDQLIRRYEKMMKVYFHNYSGKKTGFHTKLFD